MANIDIEIAGRRYNVACRDGEEAHLHSVAQALERLAARVESLADSLERSGASA